MTVKNWGYSKNIASLLKAYRLHGLFRPVPELRDTHFVLLDNDRNHIASCESCLYLDGVIATTDKDDMRFYDEVLETMKLAHREGQDVLHHHRAIIIQKLF